MVIYFFCRRSISLLTKIEPRGIWKVARELTYPEPRGKNVTLISQPENELNQGIIWRSINKRAWETRGRISSMETSGKTVTEDLFKMNQKNK